MGHIHCKICNIPIEEPLKNLWDKNYSNVCGGCLNEISGKIFRLKCFNYEKICKLRMSKKYIDFFREMAKEELTIINEIIYAVVNEKKVSDEVYFNMCKIEIPTKKESKK